MSKDKKTDRNELSKKPLWYLFLGANVLVLLACVITWILIAQNGSNLNLMYLPTLICNLLSMICTGIFAYFEVKDFAPQIMHFQRKWLKFYVAAFAVYVAAILFNVLYFLFYLEKLGINAQTWQLAIYLAITGVLTLVSIGLQRYARFRIDLDVYRRKHGENPNKSEDKIEKDIDSKKPDQSTKRFDDKKSNKPKASSGLLDQM